MNAFDKLILILMFVGALIGSALTSVVLAFIIDWQWVWDRVADIAGCVS